ncbi:hypothetical protein D3C73_278450 [compost metagenome]
MPRKKSVHDPDKLKQENHIRHLKELEDRLHLIPDPTYSFEVGESVRLGNLEDVTVLSILHDGKIIELNYTSVNNNYGNPIRNENQKGYYRWVDIRKSNTISTSFIKNDDIRLNYSQTSLEALFSKAYYFGVDFEPEYQRNYVWDESDKVKLIDAIFNNVDIGKFAFVHLSDDEWRQNDFKYSYEILDGKQRFRAILDFYESRIKYNGVFFKELSLKDQSHFKRYTINVAETQQLSRESKLRYFLMLNTGGRIMSEEHLEIVRKQLEEIQQN